MKIPATIIIFLISIYFNAAHSKSLKSFYGNSIDLYKGQRKPLASPLGKGIHDNYKRAKRQLPQLPHISQVLQEIRSRQHVPQAIQEFQEVLNKAKKECVQEMNLDPQIVEKPLMYEENPTAKEKCLMMCILKKTQLMEQANKLSIKTIGRIAGMISENNPLVVSIAVATANNCNNLIRANEPCEAAYQINKCLGRELKAHKLKFYY